MDTFTIVKKLWLLSSGGEFMSKQVMNSAKLLPKPIKPLKRISPSDVVAVIRKGRDSDKEFENN